MKKFNIIDALIIIAVVAVIGGVFALKNTGGTTTEEVIGEKLVTLEILEKHEGFSENVVIGDKVIEKVEKKMLGTVESVSKKPSEKNSYDRVTGAPKTIIIPEREDVYVTIRADKNAEVAVGKQLSVITKHFAGHGYVTKVEDVMPNAQ